MNQKKNIVFDMVGVLFQFSTRKQIQELGLLKTAKYIFTHFKNPVTTFLRTMDIIAQQEGITDTHRKYKQFYLPSCASNCFSGLENTNKTIKTIKQKIETLNPKLFVSKMEKEIVMHIADLLFSSKKIMSGLVPNKTLITLLQKIAADSAYQLFLLTNIDTQTFSLLKQSHQAVFSLFDGIVASCDIHLLKPDPAIYNHLLETYQLDPQETVFIDDQIENIEEAKKLGITAIQYRSTKQIENGFKKLKLQF